MKYLKSILLAVAVFVGLGTAVLAAFTADILITNNSSVTYDMLGANASTNIRFMADNGYFDSPDGLDTRVNLGLAAQPHMLADDRLMFAIPLPADASRTLTFTTGSSNLSSFEIIPGFSGNITALDSSNLEPGDNFTMSISGFIDTNIGNAKNLIDKADVFNVSVNGTGEIRARIGGGPQNFLTFVENDPNNVLTVTSNNVSAVDMDRDIDAWVYDDKGVAFFNAINIDFEILIDSASQNQGMGGMAVSNNLTSIFSFQTTDISVVIQQDGVGPDVYKIRLFRGAAAAIDDFVASADTPFFCSLLRTAASDTVTAEIYSDAARTTLLDTLSVAGFGAGTRYRYLFGFVSFNDGSTPRDFDGYVANLAIAPGPTVTATGVTSDEHTILVEAVTGANLTISVDGLVSDTVTLGGDSVADNSANWTFLENSSVPFADNITISVNGVQQLLYNPITILPDIDTLSANLTDRSGDGTDNWGRVTWGGGNPTGVNVVLSQLVSDFAVARADVSATQDVVPDITSPTNTADAARLANLATNDPVFYPIFNAVNIVTGISILAMYWMVFLFLAILLFFTIYRFVPNLLLSAIGFDAVIGFGVGWPTGGGIFDFWVLAVLVIFTAGMTLLEGRSPA